jgi:hypothetical protein
MLDELITRYGEDAILTVRPYVVESGETLRWIVAIDGVDVHDNDVRIQDDPDRPDGSVMSLVRGDEEIEIGRWSKKLYPHGPAAVIHRLGDLR